MIRAFIAVPLLETIQIQLAALQGTLQESKADVQWVESKNLHLTLKFLGDIEEPKVEQLQDLLEKPMAEVPSFSFQLEGLGAFPKLESPRVLWVGIGEGKELLIHLAQTIETVCEIGGFPKEKRAFKSHLTLGRVRSSEQLSRLNDQLEKANFRIQEPVVLKRVILFRSVLSAAGPAYTELVQFPLGKG